MKILSIAVCLALRPKHLGLLCPDLMTEKPVVQSVCASPEIKSISHKDEPKNVTIKEGFPLLEVHS